MGECPDQDCRARMIAATSRAEALEEERGEQIREIFQQLRGIRTSIDQNAVRAEKRDEALESANKCLERVEGWVANADKAITAVDRKIENGLRGDVQRILKILDARKAERKPPSKKGFLGFLEPGWEEFKGKASFLLVASFIIGGLWTLTIVVSKVAILHEGPAGLLKLLGIG